MKNWPAWLVLSLKVLVSALALGYVGFRLWKERDSVASAIGALDTTSVGWMVIAFIGIVFNLGLEAQKWRLLVRPFYPQVGLWLAVKAVLTGMATGIWTPNRVGEYAGRVLILPSGRRTEAVWVTFLDRLCQMAATLTFGLLALMALSGQEKTQLAQLWLGNAAWSGTFFWVGFALLGMTWMVVAFPGLILRPLAVILRSTQLGNHLTNALQGLPKRRILTVAGLSALRYLVFSAQYFFVLKAFHIPGDIVSLFPLIALVFLAKSVVPVLAFMELGIREVVAISVFGLAGLEAGPIVSATFLLYVINILFPSVVGAFFVREIRLREGGSS